METQRAGPQGVPWKVGFRGRFVSFVLLVILPFAGFEVLTISAQQQHQIQRQIEIDRELAATLASSFGNYVNNIWNMELALGARIIPHGHGFTPGRIEEMLREQLRVDPTLSALAWIDPNGSIVSITDRQWQVTELVDREAFNELADGRETSLSGLHPHHPTEVNTFVIYRAVRRDGQLAGVLAAVVNPERLRFILPTGERPSGALGLIDRQGMTIYSAAGLDLVLNHGRLPFRDSCQEPMVLRLPVTGARGRPAAGELSGACAPVPYVGWAAFSVSDPDEVLGPIRAETRAQSVRLGLVAAISLALAFFFGTRWLRPVRSLHTAVRAIAGGDLQRRAEVTGCDELTETNLLFNQMVDSIQTAQALLRRRADEAATIAHLSQLKLEGTSPEQWFLVAAVRVMETLNAGCCEIARLQADEVTEVLLVQVHRTKVGLATREGAPNERRPAQCLGGECLWAPIPGATGVFGRIYVRPCSGVRASVEDRQFLVTVANLLATAVKHENLERGRAAYLAVASILARAQTLSEAVPDLLRTLCEGAAFDWGCFWEVDPDKGVLNCSGTWHCDPLVRQQMHNANAEIWLAPGVEGPGSAWASRSLDWCEDTRSGGPSPRSAATQEAGVRTTVCIPVFVADEVYAVFDLACREQRRYDPELAAIFTAIAGHIGQYIKREQTQGQLLSSNEQLTTLVKASPAAIISTDSDYRIIGWNPAAERLFGWTEAEVRDHLVPVEILRKELSLLTAPDPQEGSLSISYAVRLRRKDGTGVDVSVLSAPLRTAGGIDYGRLAIACDITERTRFLRIAAHELRNPLAGIRGMLSLVQNRVAGNKPLVDLPQLLAVTSGEVDRLTRLLNEIFDASLTERRDLILNWTMIDLARLLDEVATPFRAAGDHELLLPDRSLPVHVMGDPDRLFQLFRNLMSNAVKYSPAGSRITVAFQTARSAFVRIAVSDQGTGIPAGDLPQVFDAFFRGSRHSGSDPGGMGLGLHICREIVRQHGGRIWAESTEGNGTVFYVELFGSAGSEGGDTNDAQGAPD
ncbi:MAG TPA: ATP-binding protein [Symbiobacteriaceae bacterium]|nr:ATP-binding protein [Symbiobacteriaceae bacterium]